MSRFESEIIAMTLDMLHADAVTGHHPGERPCGVLGSGGTESILNAVFAYRDLAQERGVSRPVMICPDTAHPAFTKAAHLFGLDVVVAPTDPTSTQVDVEFVRAAIDDRTALVVASAGNYPYGTIDPIAALSEVVLDTGTYLHVDGCLGGWILPWGQDLGYPNIGVFDYRLPGVSSISADTHKYGYGLKGTSVLTWRDTELRRHHYFAQPDWKGGLYASPTMAGSRSGGLIASTWAAMVHLGRKGYRDRARRIFDTAFAMQEAVLSHPELHLMGAPTFCFSFTSAELDIYHVNDAMAERGWRFNGQQNPAALHLAVTGPQLQPGLVETFTQDLADAVAYARTPGLGQPRSAAIYGVGSGVDGGLAALPPEALTGLIGMFLDALTDGAP
jgi:glutamate/tyrosine decarboxylase-like PLP-dependent enzyme